MTRRNDYDLAKLNVDTRYSSLPPDKVVEGNGYSHEIYLMNQGVLEATVERHPVYGVPKEWEEQAELIYWCKNHEKEYPDLKMLHHSPNGEYRPDHIGAKLKAMGTAPGFPDLGLFVARGGYHSMFIELKRIEKGKTSKSQDGWMEALTKYGFFCYVAYGWVQAQQQLLWYMGLPATYTVDTYLLNP